MGNYIFHEINKMKFICSLISAIIYQCGSSVVVTIGNFCVYFVSYIYYNNKSLNIQYGNLMGPITLLLLSIFSPFSGLIEKKNRAKINSSFKFNNSRNMSYIILFSKKYMGFLCYIYVYWFWERFISRCAYKKCM